MLQGCVVRMTHAASASVGGIVVSIAAFQAVDPGSIPGQRSNFLLSWNYLVPTRK